MNCLVEKLTTTPNPDLEQQIEQERLEIDAAPKVPIREFMPRDSGSAGRCGWCGQMSANLVGVHDYGANGKVINERYKGVECCGGRHA